MASAKAPASPRGTIGRAASGIRLAPPKLPPARAFFPGKREPGSRSLEDRFLASVESCSASAEVDGVLDEIIALSEVSIAPAAPPDRGLRRGPPPPFFPLGSSTTHPPQ